MCHGAVLWRACVEIPMQGLGVFVWVAENLVHTSTRSDLRAFAPLTTLTLTDRLSA